MAGPSMAVGKPAGSSSSGFQVLSRPTPAAAAANKPVLLTQKPLPASTSGQMQDWVQVDKAPLASSDRKGKQRAADPDSEDRAARVKDTDYVRLTHDDRGRRMVNQYVRLSELGRGSHGRVWLCEELDPATGQHVAFCAMKEVYREEQQRTLKKAQRLAAQNRQLAALQGIQPAFSAPVTPTESVGSRRGGHGSSPRPSTLADDAQSDAFDYPVFLDKLQLEEHRHSDGEGSTPSVRHSSLSPDSDDIFVRPLARPRRSALQMDEKVRQEIAIMKRCHHKHVVTLKEVINDPQSKKIFMVLEYMAGGQLVYEDPPKSKLPAMSVDQARQTFRDVLLGLEYLHYQGIIHRDIKPANLLWTDDSHSCVKISDFGVSHLSDALARDDPVEARLTEKALRKTEGSPAFFAPELCYSADYTPKVTPDEGAADTYFEPDQLYDRPPFKRKATSARSVASISKPLVTPTGTFFKRKANAPPPVGKEIDIWALGVTLYCLLFGVTPFDAETEYLLYNVIPYQEVTIPERMGIDERPTESDEGREVIDLLAGLLEKDPTKRIKLADVKHHPWVLRNLKNPDEWLTQTDPGQEGVLTVTTEEVDHATAPRLVARGVVEGGFRGSFKRAMARFGNAVNRPRRTSASSSALSSVRDGPLESPLSASRDPSRQPSVHSTPGVRPTSPPPTDSSIGRKWSVKSKFGGQPADKPLPAHPNGLNRSLSNSSAGTSHSSPTFSRRPSGSAASAIAQLQLPRDQLDQIRRQASATSADSDLERARAGRGGLEHKLSIKHVWNRLRSGSRTPSAHSSPVTPSLPLEDRPFEADQGVSAGDSDSQLGADALSIAAESLLSRGDFDGLGRRRKPDLDDEDEMDEDSIQQDDLSDDSLSELEGNMHGEQWNGGQGWRYRDHDDEQEEGVDHDDPPPHFGLGDDLRTPRGHGSGYGSSNPAFEDDDESHEDGGDGRSSSNDHAVTSGDDADGEQEHDRLEVNFGRARRQTNASELSSPMPRSRSGTPAFER